MPTPSARRAAPSRSHRTPPARSSFTLDEHGYFCRGPRRIIPLGVNYWPGSCGVELWQRWPEHEIQRDLDRVAALGLNTVRFFLRWQDFEPAAGRLERTAFSRLRQLLGWHRERGLLAHPSLFVGWMSGGVFWPEWFEGRNLFTDPGLGKRAVAFAAAAARVCAEFPDTVLAIDQGNELCCLPESSAAPPEAVTAWCGAISRAVKQACPGALVVSGNEQGQVNADTGWRFGAQPGCDFLSMHTYPNPAWHRLPFDGMADPLGRSLLPFYTACARAFGPVMVQEFGTLLTGDADRCDAYLRAVLPACAAAGANGYLWWCLNDITATGHPYDKCPFEGGLGLIDADGRVKPGLGYFLDFAREQVAAAESAGRANAGVNVYWPDHYYDRAAPANPGNRPAELGPILALARFGLESAGETVAVVRRFWLAEPPEGRRLVIAGTRLTRGETRDLIGWVERGGRLILHGADPATWGPDLARLTGAAAADFRLWGPFSLSAFGRRWRFPRRPDTSRVEASASTAESLGCFQDGSPWLLRQRLGAGRVITTVFSPEYGWLPDPPPAPTLAAWYRGVLALA